MQWFLEFGVYGQNEFELVNVLPVDSMHSFCNSSAFDCNRYYREAGPYLLNHDFRLALVRYVKEKAGKFGVDKVFIRPSSCLKPFSGRVLEVEKISLEALDHGFYYDDPNIAPSGRADGSFGSSSWTVSP